MAVTGQVMILFVLIHVLGNSTLFVGGLNAYAEKLRSIPPLVWATRIVMLAMLIVHVYLSIRLTLENNRANPELYAVKKHLKATFASKNMIWTGLVIGAFLVYHLLHFTIHVINPEMSASMNVDALGRPDVSAMVIANFQTFSISLIYIAAMIALLLHLAHGIQSSFQTLGLNNDRMLPLIIKAGSIVAVILFMGYISIPAIIFLELIKG